MKKLKLILPIVSVFVLFFVVNAVAGPFGSSITIWDNRGIGSVGNPMEDGETEPGMVNNQSWDLEGFFLKGTTLTMVGGFDFVKGNEGMDSGDIFFDVDVPSNAQYGNGVDTTVPLNGYDYVMDLDFAGKTYNVYDLTGATVSDVFGYNSPESSPWRYASGGQVVPGGAGIIGLYGYGDGSNSDGTLTDAQAGGLLGGYHYAAAVDLGWLLNLGYNNFTSHFTMECGNDNLMGKATIPVPEPATMFLVGWGLVGMAAIGRTKFIRRPKRKGRIIKN